MLKMLKFDFYKIFKSKALFSVFIVTMCLAFLDPFIYAAVFARKAYFAFSEDVRYFALSEILVWIFVVPFVSKDFSSKYIKNVYSSYSFADKIYYILSKAVYIFAMCFIWFAVHFISQLILNLIQSAVFKSDFVFAYADRGGASEGMFMYFCMFMNCFAIGMCSLFLCMLLKKEYLVLLVIMPYWFLLADLIYHAINGAILGEGGYYFIEQYSVFGMKDYLLGNTVKNFISRFTKSALVSLGYSAIFAVSSWLCFFKRSY